MNIVTTWNISLIRVVTNVTWIANSKSSLVDDHWNRLVLVNYMSESRSSCTPSRIVTHWAILCVVLDLFVIFLVHNKCWCIIDAFWILSLCQMQHIGETSRIGGNQSKLALVAGCYSMRGARLICILYVLCFWELNT